MLAIPRMSTIGGGVLSTLGVLGLVSQVMLIASLHHFKPSVPATAATGSSFVRRLCQVLRFALTSIFVLLWCLAVGVGVVVLEQQNVIDFVNARKIARSAPPECHACLRRR